MNPKQNFGCALLAALFLYFPLQAQQQVVGYRNGRHWGFADRQTGKMVVAPTLDSIGSFRMDYQTDLSCPVTWVKKNGRYGLVNWLGEWILPLKEPGHLPIYMVSKGFYAVERYGYGARSYEEESYLSASQDYAIRPVAFFDAQGRSVGKPFEFGTYIDLNDPGCGGGWEDPNGFDGPPDYDPVPVQPIQTIWKKDKVGFFDLKKAKVLVPPVWNAVQLYGHTVIAQRGPEGKNSYNDLNRFTLIDLTTGKETTLPDYIRIEEYRGLGKLFLAKHKKTGRFGFVNTSGQVIVPLKFQAANPFSTNGLTKVQSKDGKWHVLNSTGQMLPDLKENETIFPSGEIWVRSDKDTLYRKVHPQTQDEVGRIGLDGPPSKMNLRGKPYLSLQRKGKAGLAGRNRKILIRPELDEWNFYAFDGLPFPDSTLYRQYFSGQKNGRKWVFDARTFQPLRLVVSPESGLSMGENFDQSNFEMLSPVSGDSLFAIRLADGACDIMHARTGKRWGIKKAKSIGVMLNPYTHQWLVEAKPFHEQSNTRYYDPSGRFKPTQGITDNTEKGVGRRYYEYDADSGLTTIFDSIGMMLFEFRIPFPNRTIPWN